MVWIDIDILIHHVSLWIWPKKLPILFWYPCVSHRDTELSHEHSNQVCSLHPSDQIILQKIHKCALLPWDLTAKKSLGILTKLSWLLITHITPHWVSHIATLFYTWNESSASETALSTNSSLIFRDGCSLNTEFIKAIFAALLRASALVGQSY